MLPGVYWFLDARQSILYIGKAKKLRARLHSYVPPRLASGRLAALADATAATRFQTVANELTAILLEAELIRLHQPPFNIRLKDDKSSLYIVVTADAFPRVLTARRSDLAQKPYPVRRVFGPFVSARQAANILKLARRLFPFCNGSAEDRQRHHPCFYYHLGLCPGVCTGEISRPAYARSIRRLELFLSGRHRQLAALLERQISRAVKHQDFEAAARLKAQIEALTSVRLSASLAPDFGVPELLADPAANRLLNLKKLLRSRMRLANESRLHRIEAYDIANLQGTAATGSMVVLTDGEPDHQAYRHFRIRSTSTPNDFAMLREILARRRRHPEWGTPDLLVIDGGAPQLRAVQRVLPADTPLIGLAKHPDRIVIPASLSLSNKTDTIPLKPGDPATSLLAVIRDESHRFARRLHHHLQLKTLTG